MVTTPTPLETTMTVEQLISRGRRNTVTYDSFSYKDIISNGTHVAIKNIVNDYMDEIDDRVVIVELSDDEYYKWRFKPKLMCRDIYNNAELYYIILLLNGIADVKEFDFRYVRMLKLKDMTELLGLIYNAESKWMTKYNREHKTS